MTAEGEPAETVLRLSGITKRFGPLLANDSISLDLGRGEIVALLGENGAGKTTLMNILFGHYVADEGQVEAFGDPLQPGDPSAALKRGIGMVHQHFTLADQMSALENIALGTQRLFSPRFDRDLVAARIAELSEAFGLEVNPNALVADLSVGERQRVEILKALYREARILILDEPTAVLTPMETEALFATLRKLVANGLSIIFISHKLGEVLKISDRVVVLRGGRLMGERQTAHTDRKELAALMVGAEIEQPKVTRHEAGPARMSLRNVSASARVGGVGLAGADLELRSGEITGIAGVSGNGQASLAAIISGMVQPSAGEILVGGRPVASWSPDVALKHRIGRIPEDRHAEGLIADMNVAENAVSETYKAPRFSNWGLMNWNAARVFADEIIGQYDIRCPSAGIQVRLLSGGNMQKLILGRVLENDPEVILANQPTRGLDVGAVAYVHGRLIEARDRGAAILLISDDLDEVIALSDRLMVMSKGRLSTPSARGERSVRDLGELMAGHGFENAETDHAA
jgi:general nucleoside transport system ATP-binding protein